MAQLQIVIPLWNESLNIPALVQMLEESSLVKAGTAQFILVNNGSADSSQSILENLAATRSWIRVLHLQVNQNYGGGILAGLRETKAEYLGFIPGDLQIHISDVERVWKEMLTHPSNTTLYKGCRDTRMDGFSTRFVSRVYTRLANWILGIKVRDINGLPKIFHRNLLQLLPAEIMKTFVLDAQLLATAHHNNWSISEIPVVFHARREGVSSWSGKRFRVYKDSFKMLLKIRRHKLYLPANT